MRIDGRVKLSAFGVYGLVMAGARHRGGDMVDGIGFIQGGKPQTVWENTAMQAKFVSKIRHITGGRLPEKRQLRRLGYI